MAQGVVIPSGWQIHRAGELVGVPRTDLAATAGVGSAVAVCVETTAHVPQLMGRTDLKQVAGPLGAERFGTPGTEDQRLTV